MEDTIDNNSNGYDDYDEFFEDIIERYSKTLRYIG